MKKLALAMGVFVMFVVMVGTTFAGCEDDCNGPFQTCLNLCRQTTKEDSAEGSKCVDHCFHGLAGCQNRCKKSDQKSERMLDIKKAVNVVNDSMDIDNRRLTSALSDRGVSVESVPCTNPNAIKPMLVAANNSPCPGGVYCANGPCEHCCEWGYFYSTPCDCRCYKSSHDASASGCSTYFRCN